MIDYVPLSTPHAKIESRHFRGVGGGKDEVATSRKFLSGVTEQSIERGLTLNAPPNMFWW